MDAKHSNFGCTIFSGGNWWGEGQNFFEIGFSKEIVIITSFFTNKKVLFFFFENLASKKFLEVSQTILKKFGGFAKIVSESLFGRVLKDPKWM